MFKSIKKIIKKFVFKIFYILHSSYILLFHHITASPQLQKSVCVLEWEKFTALIEKYEQNFSSINDVIKNHKKNRLVLTFDDGLEDLYTKAYPYLKNKKIPFTIFIITDFIDTPGYLTTSQLQELAMT